MGDSPAGPRGGRRDSREGTLTDMLNMVSVAQTTADENTVQLEESMTKTREMEGKMEKQRRHSRELEQEVFGMHLKDVESLRKKFDEIDTDGSGTIESSELRVALERCGKRPTDKQVRVMLTKIDENGDGVLQFAEFQQMIRDWDKIIFESDEEDARIQAALEAAAPKPYVATNEPSPEERERRRSREIELGLAPSSSAPTPPNLSKGQSVNDMLNDTGSAGNSRSRSRKASKDEIPDMSEASEKTPNRQRRTNAA